ncbi:hypothetical protein [Ensifer sp.]|uniref:hypothetical protein n=1 Tax=Ensifer sp. TaxID=1872086 RepID=UPI0013AF31BE|nr:hypothetical protein [Ensifer sp.]
MRSLLTSVAVATLLLATSIQTAAAYVDPGDYYPGITNHPEDMMPAMTAPTMPAKPAHHQAAVSHSHKQLRTGSHHPTSQG